MPRASKYGSGPCKRSRRGSAGGDGGGRRKLEDRHLNARQREGLRPADTEGGMLDRIAAMWDTARPGREGFLGDGIDGVARVGSDEV